MFFITYCTLSYCTTRELNTRWDQKLLEHNIVDIQTKDVYNAMLRKIHGNIFITGLFLFGAVQEQRASGGARNVKLRYIIPFEVER